MGNIVDQGVSVASTIAATPSAEGGARPANAGDGFADEEGSDMELKPPSDFAQDMLDIVEEELADRPREVDQIDDAVVDSALFVDVDALVESAVAGGGW